LDYLDIARATAATACHEQDQPDRVSDPTEAVARGQYGEGNPRRHGSAPSAGSRFQTSDRWFAGSDGAPRESTAERAVDAKAYLTQEKGIDPSRIETRSGGN